MSPHRKSRGWWISALTLPGSLALYVLSLRMDVAVSVSTISVFGVSKSTEDGYRLLNTIRTLYESGEMTLAIAITAFTVVFPVSKYLGLGYVLWGSSETGRRRALRWIKNLGQWSMGDVFVVALLVVILRINTAATTLHVAAKPGLFVFAASVISSMIVSVILAFDRDGKAGDQLMVAEKSASSSEERSANAV